MRESTRGSYISFRCNGDIHFCEPGYFCFGQALYDWRNPVDGPNPEEKCITYEIILLDNSNNNNDFYYKGFTKQHHCFYTIDEVHEYIKSLEDTYNTKYNLNIIQDWNVEQITPELIEEKKLLEIECPYLENGKYLLTITLSGTKLKHLWILTLIRHLYEFPFNAFLHDILKIKQEKIEGLYEESLTNLLQIIISSYDRDYPESQSLFARPINKLISEQELSEKLSIPGTVHGVYFDKEFKPVEELIEYLKDYTVTENSVLTPGDLEYWLLNNEELFNKRINIYKNNKEILK